MIKIANRLANVEEYYFSKKLRQVRLLQSQGKPIINLGIGSPDLNPPERVLNALVETFNESGAHKYQSYQGIPELREAIVNFYKKQFNVPLSPLTEVLPLMGSKEGILHISMAFLNEGDKVLIPNPGYPTYESVTNLVGATPVRYDLLEENNWLPDLIALEKQGLENVKMMWVSYPHMPTGAQATNKLFEDLITFGKRNNILIVNDNPYSFILNKYPRSILKYRDAKDVCLELNSLSKTFNMAGWRVGMVLGNSEYIKAILRVKSNMDSGMFLGIQKGAIEALNCSDMWYLSLNSVYQQRREIVWKIADALNCTYDKMAAGLFVWAKLPDYIDAEEYIDLILKEKSIFIAPGTIFGTNGNRYIRLSLCAPQEELEEALARLS
ncbi:pyridoxal phosphate-dependent aminotransferase [Psychroserpens sp.]|uniref:pyridoxal phosphate-dependent aminotransferase n=1 Tax=Psychroserpens sp. TaxID=2020870 RepID=UPI001B1054BC|nr:aminotransferase class I/II-fold pyridoxal phosphate-dependent enzyme [Psychroserpens sp.]MBO6607929.1 aminotransferase class I/II-fold pyridoxal phosphate-dependent enzyme [Psychroserpens sp.]MBO6654944.1 aminotransferase class I/II-fold pyridoxal phosphate-dependent enzyme [Psychroserpens sp.]MBO6682982.1 aminotransferase class I/II-fold pyridoxal phosphate-dependent enzyme [Psychroserpens sp.]MBO6751287.1 aminotransferase class I/II-fold pyridoxal phosphate-dependent enzyme [Psychroserpen